MTETNSILSGTADFASLVASIEKTTHDADVTVHKEPTAQTAEERTESYRVDADTLSNPGAVATSSPGLAVAATQALQSTGQASPAAIVNRAGQLGMVGQTPEPKAADVKPAETKSVEEKKSAPGLSLGGTPTVPAVKVTVTTDEEPKKGKVWDPSAKPLTVSNKNEAVTVSKKAEKSGSVLTAEKVETPFDHQAFTLSDADVERIADAVIIKLAQALNA